MIAKLTTEPKAKKLEEGKLEKPPMPVSRNDIKQAMRIKCNSVICNQLRKELLSVPLIRLLNTAFTSKCKQTVWLYRSTCITDAAIFPQN